MGLNMYQHKTERRLSEETRRKISRSQILLNKDPEFRKKRSECLNGTKSPVALHYVCINNLLGKREEFDLKKNLKEFCQRNNLFLHMALGIVNKNQTYSGWSITSRRIYEIKKEEYEKENKYYVYVYLDPRKPGKYKYQSYQFDYEPFYVGKGGRGDTVSNKRWKHHISYTRLGNEAGNRHKYWKIKHILDKGLEPIVRKIKTFEIEKKSMCFEQELIDVIGRKDLKRGPLTNLLEGGLGSINVSEETRKRISNSLKGNIPWNRYKIISEEQRKAISLKVSKIIKRSPIKIDPRPVYKAKKVDKIYKFDEETRRRLSEARKGKPSCNKGKKTGKPAWNRGLRMKGRIYTQEEKILCQKNSVLNKPVAQYSVDGKLLAVFQSQRHAARELNVRREGIKDCCGGRQLSAFGFIWKFISKEEFNKICSEKTYPWILSQIEQGLKDEGHGA